MEHISLEPDAAQQAALRKRTTRVPERLIRAGGAHPMARGFHLPQRDRPAKVQHPKPAREATR